MRSLATIALLFFTGILFAQPNLEWSKNYGGSGDDTADQILTTNNGYFISGSTTSRDGDFVDNPYDTAHFIFKVNEQGVIDWINFYQREVIAIALDRNKDLIFLKDLDTRTIHLEKLDSRGQTIYEDQIISVNRTIVPKDLAMHGDGQIRIIGDLASGFSQDGIFQCTYIEENRNANFIYSPREYTGGINNYIDVIIGIEEFFHTDMFIGFNWFGRGWTSSFFPRAITEICDVNPYGDAAYASKSAACSDGSILISCAKLIKVYQDTIYTLEFNGPKRPLTGNKDHNWTFNQSNDDFFIMAIDNQGDSLYTLNYIGSGMDSLKAGTVSEDQGLVLLINSNSNDGNYPIHNGGEDIWIFKQEGYDNICLSVNNTKFKTCPQDSFLLEPYIAGCFDCTYKWEDGIVGLRRHVQAEVSDSFELIISNSLDIDSSIMVYLDVAPLPLLEYELTFDSDCPGSEFKITFDTASCNGCTIMLNWWTNIDTNVVSHYPSVDETVTYIYALGDCQSTIEIPLDVYDFEAQVNHTFCGDSNNVEVIPIGGNGSIDITWEDGSTEFQRTDLSPGFHSFVLSDSLCSIGDSSTQTNFLIERPYTFIPRITPVDTAGFEYYIELEEEYIDLGTTLYNYFLVKSKNGVVYDFEKINFFHGWASIGIVINGNIIEVLEDYFGKTYFFNFDLELLEVIEPIRDPRPILINRSDSSIIRVYNGDTIWTTHFDYRISSHIFYSDSIELIVYGEDKIDFLNFETGNIIESWKIGGSQTEEIAQIKVNNGRIFGSSTTNSNDGDLLNVNFDDENTNYLWVFEMDRNRNYKWNYLYNPLPIGERQGYPILHPFKDGLLATNRWSTLRFSSTGQEIWAFEGRGVREIEEDTISFQIGTYYDIYEEPGILSDSLNINQDSTISVNFIPGSNILWSTGDTTSTITVSDPGTYTVEIASPDGCVTIDTIIVFARSVSSTDLYQEEQLFKVYPNPNNGHFTIENEAEIQHIEIFNVMGERVMEMRLPASTFKKSITLSNQGSGLFLVKCQIGKDWITRKILVKKF